MAIQLRLLKPCTPGHVVDRRQVRHERSSRFVLGPCAPALVWAREHGDLTLRQRVTSASVVTPKPPPQRGILRHALLESTQAHICAAPNVMLVPYYYRRVAADDDVV